MKKLIPRLFAVASLALPAALRAADAVAAPAPVPAANWHSQSLLQSLAAMAAFALTGTVLAIIGYKLFDKCTPGELHKEIIEHRNVAAAIIAGAVILGVCLIIAASMVG